MGCQVVRLKHLSLVSSPACAAPQHALLPIARAGLVTTNTRIGVPVGRTTVVLDSDRAPGEV